MKKIIRGFLFLILIIGIVVIYARYIGTSGLVTHEYAINSSSIDNSFDGLKIVQFSDLHYKRVIDKEYLNLLKEEINLIKPDIIFFTGDLIDKDFDITDNDKNDLISFLSSIKSKYGKYAVNGDNDHKKDSDLLNDIYTSSDVILLNNSYDIIYGNNSDKLFIGGVDTYSYNMANIDDVMKYFNSDTTSDINYKIILVHEADYVDNILDKYDVNLVLAGHSHNGQINIPFVKNLFLPYGSKKYYKNYYHINNTDLYVSSGIGEAKFNFRLFNRPSINFYRINKVTE